MAISIFSGGMSVLVFSSQHHSFNVALVGMAISIFSGGMTVLIFLQLASRSRFLRPVFTRFNFLRQQRHDCPYFLQLE